MIKRPLAISIIGCYLVCKGVLLLFLTSFSLKDPATMEAMAKSVFPLPVALFFLFAGLAMTLVSGISILKGMNWGRVLYTTWTAIGSVVSFLTVPTRAALVPGILIFLVVVFFLFSEKANHFFKKGVSEPDAAQQRRWSRPLKSAAAQRQSRYAYAQSCGGLANGAKVGGWRSAIILIRRQDCPIFINTMFRSKKLRISLADPYKISAVVMILELQLARLKADDI